MLRDVILLGELGEKFGAHHQFHIKSAGEAVRALSANYKDFERHLFESEERGVAYKVLVANEAISELSDLHMPCGKGAIQFVPMIGGAKKGGLGGILLGGALLAASFYLPETALLAKGTMSWSSIASGVGLSLMLGGVSQLISPTPKAGKPSEEAKNDPSYYFNGPVNTQSQGQPVPLAYGRGIIGSAVISAGINVLDSNAAAAAGAAQGFLGGSA